MIKTQLLPRGITNSNVLRIMSIVPRENFVPTHLSYSAYDDCALEIGQGQTISQPYIVALMTELLELKPSDKVLEIGTGSGYQTAILSNLCRQIFTIERLYNIAHLAQTRLLSLGYRNIYFKCHDGWLGWPDYAPYDKIIVTAAGMHVPEPLVAQLAEGGRIVLPIGMPESAQQLTLGVKRNGILETSHSISVRFVPLVHE